MKNFIEITLSFSMILWLILVFLNVFVFTTSILIPVIIIALNIYVLISMKIMADKYHEPTSKIAYTIWIFTLFMWLLIILPLRIKAHSDLNMEKEKNNTKIEYKI
jgi:hypothetical protein